MSEKRTKPPITGYEDDGKNIRSLRDLAGMENNPAERDRERFTTKKLQKMEQELANEKVGDFLGAAKEKLERRKREGRSSGVLDDKSVHMIDSLSNNLGKNIDAISIISEKEELMNIRDLPFSEFKIRVDNIKTSEDGSDIAMLYFNCLKNLWKINN